MFHIRELSDQWGVDRRKGCWFLINGIEKSSNIFSAMHIAQRPFACIAFCQETFCQRCVLPTHILSGLRFVRRRFVFVAFCSATFCLYCVLSRNILSLFRFDQRQYVFFAFSLYCVLSSDILSALNFVCISFCSVTFCLCGILFAAFCPHPLTRAEKCGLEA